MRGKCLSGVVVIWHVSDGGGGGGDVKETLRNTGCGNDVMVIFVVVRMSGKW